MAYFPVQSFRRLLVILLLLLSLASRALESLTLHFSWSLDTLRRAIPMMVMMTAAIRLKMPSHRSSVWEKKSWPRP